MRRYTNLALAVLLGMALITGIAAQATGTVWARIPVVLHGATAFAIVILTPWKSLVIERGLQKRRPGWVWSIALAFATTLTVASGLIQITGVTSTLGPLTTMQVHIGGAVLTVVLAIAHYVRHPVRPRRTDLSRRTFIRTATLGVGGGALWVGWEAIVRTVGWPGATRRFTGSHERGSFDPDAMPTTQWLNDKVPSIDRSAWQVTVGTRAIGLADLEALPLESLNAVLDCTSGWYSEQEWRGVRIDELLDIGDAPSIDVRSVTGYSRRFPARDVSNLWLAFEVGGEPLSRGHGFPARLVAPGRRGFWWVKWVDTIAISNVPAWLQLPFPLE